MRFHTKTLFAATLVAGLLTACNLIQVKGQGHVHAQYGDKTIHKEVEFENLEEMSAAMKELGGAMRESTEMLAEALVEAPPPGEVTLGDVVPELAAYQGDPRIDFIAQGPSAGEPVSFRYVQIGVPSYDAFFKASTELYALAYQTKQTVFNLRTGIASLKGSAELTTGDLKAELDSAMGLTIPPAKLQTRTELHMLAQATKSVAASARGMVAKTQELVGAGQQLIAGAPSSITNPKTIIHMDLIVDGLTNSVAVTGESGKLLTETLPLVAGF